MARSKHTPKPWRLPTPEEAKRWMAPYLILDAEGGSLADASPGFPMDEETKLANACLMVASPELLDACIEALGCLKHVASVDPTFNGYGVRREVIKKLEVAI